MSTPATFDVLALYTDDLVVRLDAALCCRFANASATRFSGANAALEGQPLATLGGRLGDVLRAGESAIETTFRTGQPQAYTFEGPPVLFEVRVLPEVVAGAVPSVLVVTRDVPHGRGLQARLQEQELALRAVLDTVPDAVMMGNAAGEITGVNRAAERIFGYTEAELRGKNARILFDGPLGQRDDLLARFGTMVLRYGQRGAYEAVGRRKDGSTVPVELLLSANDVGGARYYTGVIRDVSERKASDRALQESGDRYRALSRLIGAFALEYRIEATGRARLDWVTQTVTPVLGYAVAEALSLKTSDLLHPDDAPLWADLLRRVRGGEEATAEIRVRNKRGRYVWLRLLAYPVRDDAGRVVRIHAAAQDVTAQKLVEAELMDAKERAEEASQLKDAFLASMSHEIRTPLTAILGFTEVLRQEAPEEIREYVDLIDAGGRRLMDTLTSVLELAQLRARTIALKPARLNVAEVLQETAVLLGPAASKKGLAMTVEADPNLDVWLDRGAFVRILTNLVGNAVKFTTQGEVRLSAARKNGDIVVRVQDTGEGIEDAFLPFLFDEFRQESSGLARRHEGNGLGLAITKQLVDLMGGAIQVQSRKHEGTEFIVRLPVPPAPPETEHPQVQPATSLMRPRVLVVEDQAPSRRLLEILLRPSCEPLIVGSPREALDVAAREQFDCALLDINLGEELAGTDLRGLLQQTPGGARARYVAMTAYALPGDRERLLDAGFDAYVAKPFTSHTLSAAIAPLPHGA
ncbi:MAG TPA: PAS domain S-box protein [Rhodothermales bacterium]|nr:PAS domain S-box protein [Rhodothermales bacterium]